MTDVEQADRKSELLDQLTRQSDWIKNCDAKASIAIGGLGIFLAAISSEFILIKMGNVISQAILNLNFSNLLYLSVLAINIVSLFYGVHCLIRVIVPRLSKELYKEKALYTDSLFFFEMIARNEYADYEMKVNTREEAEKLKDLTSQVYINAKICTVKHQWFSKGIKWAMWSVGGLIILFFIGVLLLEVGGI
jgi:hypothetical protein